MPKDKKMRRESGEDRKKQSLADFDLHALEKEWHRHPRMVEKIVDQLVEAKRDHEAAKYQLTVVQAKVAAKIRRTPARYGIEKGTEKEIEAAVVLHEDMQAAHAKMLEALDRKNTLDGYLLILEHRKRALEKEVDLWQAGYFSSPKQPKKGDRVRPPRTGMRDG